MAKRFGYKGKYANDAPKKNKKAMPLLFLVVGVALLCLMSGILAKYIKTTDDPGNQVGAKDFYFTIDLFKVVDSEPEQDDENQIVERTFGLYGGGQNQLNFKVQNFFDDLRINGEEITYTISYETTDGLAAVLTNTTTNEVIDAKKADITLVAGESGTSHTYNIKATSDPIPEGSKMIVTVEATKPYAKKMVLTVELHPEQYDVLYRLEDVAGQSYAKLIIMAGVAVDAEKLNIDWSAINTSGNVLQIDTTNTKILGEDKSLDGTNDPGTGYLSKATNAVALNENESVAIYFFKADPSQDYTIEDTVAALTDGKYQIIIK